LLEISCRTEKEARQLVREFGGTAEKLRIDWLEHFAKQAQSPPLRIDRGSSFKALRIRDERGRIREHAPS
jgi:hypothetical protein